MRRLSIIFTLLMLVVLLGVHTPTSAQSTPQLLAEIPISDSTNNKFPNIATYNQTVYVGGSVSKNGSSNNTDAMLWTLAEQATSIGSGVSVGGSYGKPDYSTTAVATGPDGSVYVFWGSINEQTLYLRRRDSSGNWGSTYTVTSGDFPIFQQIAVDSTGKVYVIWQGVNIPLSFKYSTNQGASWSSTYTTSHTVYSVPPSIAIGPNNEVVIGLTSGDLMPGIAIWTGSALSSEIIASDGAANTSAAIGPDGSIYATWRGIDEGTGWWSGVHYAQRISSNTWNEYQLVSGNVKGPVTIKADSSGTLHIGWIALVSGNLRFHYAYRQAGQQFSTAGTSSALGIFNSRMDISSSGAYAHAALEDFSAGSPRIVYVRFSGGSPSISVTPQIANNTTYIKGLSSVSVNFVSVVGNPTQIRWRWGSEPSDSSVDSNGWETYTNPKTITIPDRILSSATCSPVYLYVQARNASLAAGSIKSDSVIIDTGVTAGVLIANPHTLIRQSQFTQLNDISTDGGASDGDLGYTRDQSVYISAQGDSDCSGIQAMAMGRDGSSFPINIDISNNHFSNVLAVPGTFVTGSNTIWLRVTDAVGNVRSYSGTIIYDPVIPILNPTSPGTFTAASHSEATILTNLEFKNINVSDTFPGRMFWGVWLANSRGVVNDPINDTSLTWYPVAAPNNSTSFTINNWSLASGLSSSQLTTGDYYIYARILDGAGNPTATAMPVVKLTLTNITLPKLFTPMTIR
ncbi:MAG: hypothetical protein HGA65_07665 [Oscillochloris sp.]|nr:hypothetical protein [Oscillochloris sp.]